LLDETIYLCLASIRKQSILIDQVSEFFQVKLYSARGTGSAVPLQALQQLSHDRLKPLPIATAKPNEPPSFQLFEKLI
jgi:hypothetical protein